MAHSESASLLRGDDAADKVSSQSYPKSVYFIIGNEFCERFSYYGMRAILAIYLTSHAQLSEDMATTIVHGFIFFCYIFPMMGGMIADSWWGKYRTILNLSLVYCVGSLTLAATAVPEIAGSKPHIAGILAGLLLIAIGTGGIKPCVAPLGGDQFSAGQTELMASFFAFLYLAINLGSLISTIATPAARYYISFAVAFAIPAALLLVSTWLFWAGRHTYHMVPPQGAMLVTMFQAARHALAERRREKREGMVTEREHWMDRAAPKYDEETIEAIKAALRVLTVFLPTPMFWALFDQQVSRWIFQAEKMDGHIVGGWTVLPDQMPVMNSLFIVSMIPVFQHAVYPTLRRCGMSVAPLRRMSMGMVLCVLSFVLAGMVESQIEAEGEGNVHIAWQIPQYFVITCAEILFSITGLEFAYSQAPPSMKSVLMAAWLTTVAFGNLFVIVIAAVNVFSTVMEYFFFATLMGVAALIFMFIASRYKYRSYVGVGATA